MLLLIGGIIVLVSVLGGFMLEKGNPTTLIQPAEMMIIAGAAVGSFLIASPKSLLVYVIKSVSGSIKGGRTTGKKEYLGLLILLFKLFSKIRKEGLVAVEPDIENPGQSAIFRSHAVGSAHVADFICDNMKVIITTNVPSHELENLMDLEIETRQNEAMAPSKSLAKVADALPGLGIVAAVLGVVLTMGKIDQPPAVLGACIADALTGTFFGILLSYGFVSPLSTNLEHRAKKDEVEFQIIKVAIVSFVGGAAPQIAVEFGRRAVPGEDRPSFNELEKEVRGAK